MIRIERDGTMIRWDAGPHGFREIAPAQGCKIAAWLVLASLHGNVDLVRYTLTGPIVAGGEAIRLARRLFDVCAAALLGDSGDTPEPDAVCAGTPPAGSVDEPQYVLGGEAGSA